ncbi:class D beta-lactamase [Peribacillus cavernae]|uniref:Beta-lactamase n=1 Tax=Peribacillus cavernae TaxID=1674310 RepID=A0A3S0UJ69_9BACI|nr:class D beta-lactamase [Peribacillus cavernae]MDQ0221131.1 beta-lactamase class D [Peribacillus cavernae]RUQ32829.1 class D beta-lactamase [Peribacillus cavernae]
MRKLMYLSIFLLFIGIIGFTAQAQALSKEVTSREKLNVKKSDVAESFSDQNGTFILRDVKTGKTFVYNKERANTRQTPESTFKVPNALIGLQVKAVRDEYDVKQWDGVKWEFDTWNRDHTLGSAMRESVIWYYQAMARDIGEQRMRDWVQKISYGNEDISGGIDHFWLSSSLKISPLEQANFMEKLYKEELPFDKPVMKTVKRMMILEEGEHYTLYGKTGTRLSDLGLGWFVGFIKVDNRSYVFVTNIDNTGTKAKNITKDILKKYHLITE